MDNDLGIGEFFSQFGADGVAVFVCLAEAQAAVKFEVEFEHISAAEVMGSQIMHAADERQGGDGFFHPAADFVGKFAIKQQGNGVASQQIGIVQEI